jgi:hypothetical protein
MAARGAAKAIREAAALPAIKSRQFGTDGTDSIPKKLAFLDMKHDFGAGVTADIPHAGRGGHLGQHNFFSGFKTTIVRKVMGLGPSYSYEFDGCNPSYSEPEDFGLREAVEFKKLRGGTHIFEKGIPLKIRAKEADISGLYSSISKTLEGYKVLVNGKQKIPLVIDYQYQLLDHGRAGINGLTDNFVICKNREHYADPGRTSRIEFTNIETLIEIGREGRTYPTELTGVPGNVVTTWDGSKCSITYGDLEWTETYSADLKKYPNVIPMCILTANSLIKQNEYNLRYTDITGEDANDSYCKTFERSEEYGGVAFDSRDVYVKRIAAQFIKKRLADQLQAASCLETITYTGGITIGGAEKPCVFWTHDRLAAAFAILNGIPCVLEHSESAEKKLKKGGRKPATPGSVTVYVPLARVEGQGGRGIKRRERGAGEEEFGEGEAVPVAGISKKGRGAKEGGARRIVQKGGACTRGDIDAIIPKDSTDSSILIDELNNEDGGACNNYILQTIMTFNEGTELNPYFDFDVLRRYIDYTLVKKGKRGAAAGGGGEPGEPWDGWPESKHDIKKLENGRFYVNKERDSVHIADGSANIYVNGHYALRIDVNGSKYKLMNVNAVEHTINITDLGQFDVGDVPQEQEGGGNSQRAIYRKLHAFASLLRKTELEFAFIPESGELFLDSSIHAEYHARDLYFFFQELMKLGELACKAAGEDIRFLTLFQDLIHNLPTLLIEEAGNTGLCERVRLYLTTVDDYPFKKGKHDRSVYEKVLPWFQLLVKATYANAYNYTNRAPLGGISYWASSFLMNLEGWKMGAFRIAAPLHTRISPQTVKRLPAGILAGGRGGGRHTRKRVVHTLRGRRSTRRRRA